MASKLSFAVDPLPHHEDVLAFVPVVDDVPLTTLVDEFEAAGGMEPHGDAYAGLIPRFVRLAPAAEHYAGGARRVPLLGCQCGVMACWPLMARIAIGPNDVVWSDFEQPYRPERDYSAFGPFFFVRAQYEAAVRAIAGDWEARG